MKTQNFKTVVLNDDEFKIALLRYIRASGVQGVIEDEFTNLVSVRLRDGVAVSWELFE
jgi:hypothetical protein